MGNVSLSSVFIVSSLPICDTIEQMNEHSATELPRAWYLGSLNLNFVDKGASWQYSPPKRKPRCDLTPPTYAEILQRLQSLRHSSGGSVYISRGHFSGMLPALMVVPLLGECVGSLAGCLV